MGQPRFCSNRQLRVPALSPAAASGLCLESAGVKDVLTKSMGSSNRINVARATLLALKNLRLPEEELAKRKPAPKVVPGPTPARS